MISPKINACSRVNQRACMYVKASRQTTLARGETYLRYFFRICTSFTSIKIMRNTSIYNNFAGKHVLKLPTLSVTPRFDLRACQMRRCVTRISNSEGSINRDQRARAKARNNCRSCVNAIQNSWGTSGGENALKESKDQTAALFDLHE